MFQLVKLHIHLTIQYLFYLFLLVLWLLVGQVPSWLGRRAPQDHVNQVSLWLEPLLHLVHQNTSRVFPHISEQDSEPTTSLISKQVVPYRTRGGTCCPRVSTPKTLSLAYLSMTTHNTWWNPTASTIPNLAQTTVSNLTTVTSHHDGWKTNTFNTQHKPNSTS
jgi:hypothetical protein